MNTKLWAMVLIVGAGVVGLGGCAAEPAGSSPAMVTADAAGHAECLVCKKNADLACVDIKLKTGTPEVIHLGKTYYFCSAECQKEFQKHPEKYISQK